MGPPSESPNQEARKTRLVKSKTYKYDIWEDIKEKPADISYGQLMEISPTVRQQFRTGLAAVKPNFEVRQVNSAQETQKTPAYATCQVEDHIVEVIIDTGAGIGLISKDLLDKLRWHIEEPTNLTLVVADGKEATPLGMVKDIPVRFGNCTITVDKALVTQSTTYELILGNVWLHKARAIIDLHTRKMRISNKGKAYDVPLDTTRGIRPELVNPEEERDLGDEDIEEINIEYEEEAEAVYTVQETIARRYLTPEEKASVCEVSLIQSMCPFCGTRQYCAELQDCQCPETV